MRVYMFVVQANKAAAGSGSPSRVLFRPAPVLIPDGSEERLTDSISPGKASMGGMLSKKFRGTCNMTHTHTHTHTH